jgi:cellulose synthase/poly-beta-1,6-N-acetylglucosamine synthase-like glycosyltransferase
MQDILELGLVWGIGALGLLSLIVFAAAALYMLAGLWQQRRPVALLIAASLLALAFTPPGAWIISLGCALVVTAQAVSYVWFAARALRSRRRPEGWQGPLPSVTLIVPAKDEELVIESTLASLGGLDYPRDLLQVVVVDDGSTDATLARAQAAAADLRHGATVVHFEASAGKARRVNEVVRTLDSEFVLLLDADHWVECDFIQRLLDGFGTDRQIACVQVASQVRNGGTNLLTRSLEMEYLFRCRGIYPGKPLGIFVGSGGMFRRSALLEVGGFDPAMLTEDVEITYRLYGNGQRVVYDDSTCSYDLAPVDFRNFFNQRHRWMRGLFQALARHAHEPERHPALAKALPYLVQFTLDGFGVLCSCVLQAYFTLGAVGLLPFRFAPAIFALLASSTFAFAVGFVRAGRLDRLLSMGLLPLYMVAHTIPMAWALIDGYVLGKPIVWVKTERGVQASDRVGLSGGRA